MSDSNYENINSLISHDQEAKEYYMSLNEKLQGALNLHSDSIHTFEDLKYYVKKLNVR